MKRGTWVEGKDGERGRERKGERVVRDGGMEEGEEKEEVYSETKV